MIKFIAALALGIWLYFGTFLAASPSFAVDTALSRVKLLII